MINHIYTIGYSGFKIDSFIDTLKTHNINALIDVRSSAYSKYFSDYNKSNLEKLLPQHGIHYRNYVEEFGARQENKAFYPNGYLDFELFAQSVQFKSGVKKILAGMKKNYIFALMCAEKDPINCHRTSLVARAFAEAGCKVIHLQPNGVEEPHSSVETRLLDKYYPDRYCLSLFDEAPDDDELLKRSYRMRNQEIGYKLNHE